MTARLPSLNGFRAFGAAGGHLSFTLAAAELDVTQTAISHQIRRLEEELGLRLFVRKNRALTLTPKARDYLPGGRPAFNDLRRAGPQMAAAAPLHLQGSPSEDCGAPPPPDQPGRLQERRPRCRDPLWAGPL